MVKAQVVDQLRVLTERAMMFSCQECLSSVEDNLILFKFTMDTVAHAKTVTARVEVS